MMATVEKDSSWHACNIIEICWCRIHSGWNVYFDHSQEDVCPVATLLSYMAVRGAGQSPLFWYRPLI